MRQHGLPQYPSAPHRDMLPVGRFSWCVYVAVHKLGFCTEPTRPLYGGDAGRLGLCPRSLLSAPPEMSALGSGADFTGVRYMHCILPDTDAAEQLAREQILETGLEAAAHAAIQDEEGAAPKSGGCTTITVRELLFCVGPVDGPFYTCDYVEYDITICEDDSDEGSSGFPDGDDGGASGGGNENGDDGQGCGTGDGPATSPVENPPPGSDCEPVDPCESDDPPPHCDDEEDDVTPCSEVEFDNDTHAEIMETLDELGILEALKDESNFGANQGDRLENGRWIVRNEDGTIETEPFDQTADSPLTLGNPGPPPANAVGSIHTHPFSDEEVFTDHGIVENIISDKWREEKGVAHVANPDSFPNYKYTSRPSPGDYEFSSSFLELDYTGESHHFVIDEDGVIEY